MRHDGGTAVDGFNAARTSFSRDPRELSPEASPSSDDMALQIGRYERNAGASEACSEGARLDRQS